MARSRLPMPLLAVLLVLLLTSTGAAAGTAAPGSRRAGEASRPATQAGIATPAGPGADITGPVRPAAIQEAAGPTAEDLSHLEWRNVGPAMISGRIVDFAVVEDDPSIIYTATSGGGVWKSIDGGIMWEPVFDGGTSSGIGGIAVTPSNPSVVWAGTGEASGRNLVSTTWGEGVFKSEDAGGTWELMGLEDCQHVGRIRIHPQDPDVVWVPCLGALWQTDEEDNASRGLWKTADGGATWSKVLSAGDHGGIVDLDLDPRDPDRLYATAWHRTRRDWSWIGRGAESGVYRSQDGGDTWELLENGLPGGETGRPGVSVCRSRPDRVYVVAEAGEGGVYRSDDRGASWTLVNAQTRSSQWYGQIRCDPNDPDRVWVLGTRMALSEDGGATFDSNAVPSSVHVDHHALWIDPADSRHQVLGNDGGIYISRDDGESWRYVANLPIVQFYEIGADMREPFYHLYGGTQDNSSWGGPSRTRNEAGIVNDDWYLTTGGDGFYARIDPEDPRIVYTESQNGNLVRFDTVTGTRKRIRPDDPEEGEEWRWDWSAPVLISQHDPAVVYFGANVLFRSPDRGDTWEVVSPDLTKQLTYEDPMNDFGALRVIAESPFDPDVLAVGTDDGLVQVTRDGGETWQATEGLPGAPELAMVRRLAFSPHDADTLYAAWSHHEYNDFRPFVGKSTDMGRSWEPLMANLPEDQAIRAMAVHHRTPGLLFVGTERGVWVTFDDGASWVSLQNDLPTAAIWDMLIHPRENDLVIGTGGRGMWILDAIHSLEEMATAVDEDVHLFPVRPALQLEVFDRGRGWQGTAYYAAPNPPVGALIDYRVSADALPEATGGGGRGGGGDGGRGGRGGGGAAARIAAPAIRLDVLDGSGQLVRRLEVPQGRDGAGSHRVVWDLRHAPAWIPPEGEGGTVRGPLVLPGEYRLRLQAGEAVAEQTVQVLPDPDVRLSDAGRRLWHDTSVALARLVATARGAAETLQAVQVAVDSAVRALGRAGDPSESARQAVAARAEALSELGERAGEVSGTLGSTYNAVSSIPSLPTAGQMAAARRGRDDLAELLPDISSFIAQEMAGLGPELEAAGVPWSLGRALEMPGVELPELPGGR